MKVKSGSIALALAVAVVSTTTMSCDVNEYCLNCGVGEDGGMGDAGGDGPDGPTTDANDASTCVPSGNEVCDNKDNDCDNAVDEGDLPEIGDNCENQTGECAGGKKICTPEGTVVCDKPPSAEQCDGLDNDCDGTPDQGDPGGGAKCGTEQGECVAGRLHCNTVRAAAGCSLAAGCDISPSCVGASCCCISCGLDCGTGTPAEQLARGCPIGGILPPFGVAETCDARDNDCDGDFDEDVPTLGFCQGSTVSPTNDPNEGLCQQGTATCDGAGGTICSGATNPTFEDCDGADNDCDADIDEDTAFDTDPTNCGACNFVCSLPNAINGCVPTGTTPAGRCTVLACETAFHDNNNTDADGCEFGPCTIQSEIESCNGIDDDCNPATNETNTAVVPVPPNFCLDDGACQGATASCQGDDGFVCNYGAGVEHVDGVVAVQESKCDGIDNDCDGIVDEGEIGLNTACVEAGKQGVCQGSGFLKCVPNQPDAAPFCQLTVQGQPVPDAQETCDAKDNDCDGDTDEGAETGDLIGQDWVTIPGLTPALPATRVEIMKYEASRTDASATAIGIDNTFACSKQDVLPWTNITHPQAEAACASVGARLCSEIEWQSMCDPKPAFPIPGPAATGFAYVEAEYFLTPKTQGSAAGGGSDNWLTQLPVNVNLQDFSGTGAMRALLDNGTSVTLANAPANSARLDFQFNGMLAATNYVVWARVLAPATSSDTIHFGLNLTAPGTANGGTSVPIAPLSTWVWVKSGTIATTTAGTYIASIYMAEDGVFVDAVALTRQTGTTPPPFDERTWAYQNNPKTAQDQACNGDEFDTTAGGSDQDAVLKTKSLAQCFANGTSTDDAFDMSGNVKEWAGERAAGQNPLRGGAANNEVDGLTCGLNFTLADDTFFFPNVGYRCCRLK